MSKEVCKCKRFVEYRGSNKPKFHRDQPVYVKGQQDSDIVVNIYQSAAMQLSDTIYYDLKHSRGWGESVLTAAPSPEGSRLVEHKENPPKFHKGQRIWSKNSLCSFLVTKIEWGEFGRQELRYWSMNKTALWECDATDVDPNAKPECCSCPCHNKETE